MEVAFPFSKGKPTRITGRHLFVLAVLFLVLLAAVSLQLWGSNMTFSKVAEKGVAQEKKLSFSVDSEFQDALENGVISAGLRQEFSDRGVTLSENAKAFTVDQGSRWFITDVPKLYDVTKRASGLTVAQQFSFGSSSEFQNALESGVISEGLKRDFGNHGITLSDKAKVSTLAEGSRWRIRDGRDIYDVTSEGDRLKIDQKTEVKRKVFLGEPVADKVDGATKWVTREGSFIFDAIRDFIKGVLTRLEDGLLWIPWPAFIAMVSLLAWRMAGFLVALFSAFGLLAIGFVGLWPSAMETLSLMLTSVTISIAIAVPLGILAARNDLVDAVLRPILDGMQTMPSFVYLVPVIFFFGLGNVPAVFATIIYAVPPAIRLTNLGIRQVSAETVEAARAFGATPFQLLMKVQIPLALPTIMAGVNQTTMMALAMVVVASLVGAGGLGEDVLRAIGRLEIGNSLLAGMGIVFMAIIIDRITQGFTRARQMVIQE